MTIERSWNTARLLMVVLVGLSLVPFSVPAGEFEEPTNCRLQGEGTLDGGDISFGDLSGTGASGLGSWAHIAATDTFSLVPATVTCRINGIEIGDSTGTVAGTGQSYILHIEDIGSGTPQTTQILRASRSYSPSTWVDGNLVLDGVGVITIPSELAVIAGDAEMQWAWVSFTRSVEGDMVTCRYRGNESGDAYVFTRCTGEDDDTSQVEAGDRVAVASMTLHVHSGCQDCGTTEVEATLEMSRPESDFLLIQITDVDGTLVYEAAGFVVTGDFSVESLD
ncbi:MAG: hypothetical protein ABFS45_21585 [Pseudomonadota bacterium]